MDANEFQSLIHRARDGSSDALNELLVSCQTYLLLVANQELDDRLQAKLGASDVVQSVFAKAHRGLAQFQGTTREELLGWLRAILHNQLGMLHRRYAADKRDVRREMTADGPGRQLEVSARYNSPRAQVLQDEEALLLRRSLAQLPDEYRQVVILRNWEQLSFEEIGVRLGRSSEATRKLWTRALGRLQKIMRLNQEASHGCPPESQGAP